MTPETSCIVSDLKQGTKYNVTVTAINSIGESRSEKRVRRTETSEDLQPPSEADLSLDHKWVEGTLVATVMWTELASLNNVPRLNSVV